MKYFKWALYAWLIMLGITVVGIVIGRQSVDAIVACFVLLGAGVFAYMVAYLVTGRHKKLR